MANKITIATLLHTSYFEEFQRYACTCNGDALLDFLISKRTQGLLCHGALCVYYYIYELDILECLSK